jgi:O-antigen/teichoic acid export membrane protein
MLQIILPGFVAYGIYALLSSFMIVNGKAGLALLASLGGLAVNVLFSYLLIPKHGGMGAAQALCGGYLTATLLMFAMVSVIFKVPVRSLLILEKQDVFTITDKVRKFIR